MFSNLTEKLGKVFARLTSVGYIREEDINLALREIRVALLEADVALDVVKELTRIIKEKALGQEVIKSTTPGQMVVKIVQDCLTEILEYENSELEFNKNSLSVFLILGLQGSGKTTSSAKLAKILAKQKKKVLLASVDTYRPAAQLQLAQLASRNGLDCLAIIEGQKPLEITKRAMEEAKKNLYDVLIIDTAGRLHIDDELMDEISLIESLVKSKERILVADSMTGQDSINIARSFNDKHNLTGIVLTRLDGDSRGGAALSMSFVTKVPVKFLCTGEAVDDIEKFSGSRIASRILGMGDIVSLVEKASELVSEDEAKQLEERISKGNFNLNHLAQHLEKLTKLGGIGKLMSMIPGVGSAMQGFDSSSIDPKIINWQIAIIRSMTKKERQNPLILNASRKKRIAAGSGRSVQEINKLIKSFLQMQNMMKKFKNFDKSSLLKGGFGKFFPKS